MCSSPCSGYKPKVQHGVKKADSVTRALRTHLLNKGFQNNIDHAIYIFDGEISFVLSPCDLSKGVKCLLPIDSGAERPSTASTADDRILGFNAGNDLTPLPPPKTMAHLGSERR